MSSLDSSISHGQSFAQIDFAGRDTTRIDGQVKQTITVRPVPLSARVLRKDRASRVT